MAELSQQVKALSEERAAPADREREFAENFRDALNDNLTPWFGPSEGHDDAA